METRATPPAAQAGPAAWLKANLFSSALNSALTILIVIALVLALPPLVSWAFVNAVFAPDPNACRATKGACWGFVVEKHRLMIFGVYPYDQQWRPLAMMLVLVSLIAATMRIEWWGQRLWIAWAVGVPAMWLLMRGGVPGLPYVETDKWGGLPLTLILSATGIVGSFPLAIALALGRRSELPIIRALSVGYIELVRGVPLITVLFMASLMIPLFLPEGMTPDKLLRAQIGFILFAAAYEAEVVRAGLQAIPKGQYEAADALGLSYWSKMGLVVLPQALKVVIPPMVNTFIGLFKDTSLVIIIGLIDFLGAVRLASSDVEWRVFYVEGLVFVALVYFAFCYAMASYSRRLEARLNTTAR